MFQVVLPCYLGLNSGRPVSINVNKTRKHFSRTIHGARMFPQFPIWETLFPVSALLFLGCKLCLRYTAGDFNETPSMRAHAKILRASKRGGEGNLNIPNPFNVYPLCCSSVSDFKNKLKTFLFKKAFVILVKRF